MLVQNSYEYKQVLEAQQQSLRQTHRKAISLYEAAIESAKKSGYIHEQRLACENL